jgi:hypothetical protein
MEVEEKLDDSIALRNFFSETGDILENRIITLCSENNISVFHSKLFSPLY